MLGTDGSYGPFVIIQLGVVVMMAIGGAYSLWNGRKTSRSRSSIDTGNGVQLFFDGPLNKALGSLEGIYRVLSEMRADNTRAEIEAARRIEAELELLRDIRDGQRPTGRR
jgi:hypothetical protein